MSDELVKTDNPDFQKDITTGALLSTDVAAFRKYKLQQQQAEEAKIQKNDLNNIKSEVSDLRNELGEIKDILKQLLNK